ncbi:unnamed protein product [Clonostachys byssicola]|uniref:Pectate lyase n=1 Tax=Clonostachys byssicola TaxID=160290 RepID=A0A9N9UKL2_9HYPO|nr:unnamed protein product [Clonostachys byssicola]
MKSLAVFLLFPLALGCLNPTSNSCASYIKSNSATASPFCATFTKSSVTATTSLPSWATNCSNKPSMISAECSCHYSGSATATTTKTTTTGGGGGTVPTGVTTTLPASAGATSTSKAITVSGSFDGGMKKYDRSPRVCAEQDETGEADAMFVLEDGATLSNVIIGPDQAEGVHCKGTWHSSGTSYVNGGGAFKAADKIIQFNGRGTVQIQNFYANDYGKVVRSCGNCSNNGGPRNIIMNNVVAVDGGVLCGINTNYGDTCVMTNCCQDDGKSCDRYTGNSNGSEPSKIGSGPDGTYCKVSGASTNC